MLVQGRGSRSELLNQFRADGNAILLGTGSFWQGVDVRGRALRLVMIDKLPFAVPSDPLVQARAEAIRRAGGDAFNELQLPQAVLALKQGVGRLIRDFDDRGLIVLGDPRLRTRGYGAKFLASLPAMPVIDDFASALEFAASLAEPAAARAGRGRVMNLLGLETSSARRLGRASRRRAACSCARSRRRASKPSRLLALIDELLARSRHQACRISTASRSAAGPARSRACASAAPWLRVSLPSTGVPLLPVSSLLCLAERAWREHGCERALVCVDAHMGEVYWASLRAARRRRSASSATSGSARPTRVAGAARGAGWSRRRRRLRGATPEALAGRSCAPRSGAARRSCPSAAGLVPPGRSATLRPAARRGAAAALPVYLREQTAWRRSS